MVVKSVAKHAQIALSGVLFLPDIFAQKINIGMHYS